MSKSGVQVLTNDAPPEPLVWGYGVFYTRKQEKIDNLNENIRKGWEFRTSATCAERSAIENKWMQPSTAHINNLHAQFPAVTKQLGQSNFPHSS